MQPFGSDPLEPLELTCRASFVSATS
jgi:hypothetical protein